MDSQPLLIESICIKDQRIQSLEYHNKRANLARVALYKRTDPLDFSTVIDVTQAKETIVKCRIVYGEKIESIEYQQYNLKAIRSLKVIEIDDTYKYDYKYLDRGQLDAYFSQRGEADDMIMIQNGFVTDSYYGNLAFLKNGIWYTPEKPLLMGTKRAYLINENKIVERQIAKEEIIDYESVRIFNAMIEFGQIEVSSEKLRFPSL